MTAVAEAVVLAGGEGRPLQPTTTDQPKLMLPMATRPIVEYVLDAPVENGVEHAVGVGHPDATLRPERTEVVC